MTDKERYLSLLNSISRDGLNSIIQWLNDVRFFESPASTKYHLAHRGGLCKHSLNVYTLFDVLTQKFKLNIDREALILCSLLHDVCKAGAYISTPSGYIYNSNHPKGHAKLSLERIKLHIKLTFIEQEIIKYHMGFYGLNEFSQYGEYSLMELLATYNNSTVTKLFYFCDDMSAQFLEK